MLYTKFRGNRPAGSGKEDFEGLKTFLRDQRYLILISRIWRFELWDIADFG